MHSGQSKLRENRLGVSKHQCELMKIYRFMYFQRTGVGQELAPGGCIPRKEGQSMQAGRREINPLMLRWPEMAYVLGSGYSCITQMEST